MSAPAARRGRTVRVRVLATMLVFMAGGLAVAGVVTYSILFATLVERIDGELYQEVEELRLLAGQHVVAGDPLPTVSELLSEATDAAVPSRYESVLALTDGEPRFRPRVQDFDLTDPQVLDIIRASRETGRTVLVDADSSQGELRIVIASVHVDGDPTEGTFVIANAVEQQRANIWFSARRYAAVSVGTLILAGGVGWAVAGRLLKPVGELRRAVGEIGVEQLGQRVPVPETGDDVAALADSFNQMLARLEVGYDEQRQFLRDAGHELRTPLTIVSGTLEMMTPDDPADFAESREIALEELERMGGLIGDLSLLAQAKRPDFATLARVDLRGFAGDALDRLNRLSDRPWTLVATMPHTAEMDAPRMLQAVLQLGANALRYSDPGTSLELSIGIRSEAGATAQVRIGVRDHGIGIAPEDIDRIFDRFVRVDAERDQSGSGLGLPIVHAIVAAHQGHIEVDSVPGEGSKFTIVFPQRAAQTAAGRQLPDQPHQSGGSDAHPGR